MQSAKGMRLGLLSQWYEPEPARIAPVLARELAVRQHAVRVLTGFPNFPEGRLYEGYRMRWRRDEVVSGVPVRRVALYPSHSRSTAGRLANYGSFALSSSAWGTGWFKEVGGLWVQFWPSIGLPMWLIKARYRPRVVLHVMDLWPESLHASGFGGSMEPTGWLARGLDRMLALTYDVADSIACISRAQIEMLAQRGVPRSRLSHAPVWADETVFYPSARNEALAARLGVQGKTVLLYAGSLGDAQGLDVLIEACENLSDEPTFQCLIAGAGVAEADLRDRAQKKHLANVTFLGRWPTSGMPALMSIGDVHLVSLRLDPIAALTMPSKVPATLACAKPLIVVGLGEVAEVVNRSGAGWTCVPGDRTALEGTIRAAVAAGPSALRGLGQRARTFYENEFAVGIGVQRVEQLLAGDGIRG
jgi:colanic acid biosynthesis glycosyl transferase WcaI